MHGGRGLGGRGGFRFDSGWRTLRLKEYKTIWSAALVTLRWRTERRRACSPATSLSSWLGFRRDSTLRLAWLSTIVTSMSATAGRTFFSAACRSLAAALVPPLAVWVSDSDAEEALAAADGGEVEDEYWGKVKKREKGGRRRRPAAAAAP